MPEQVPVCPFSLVSPGAPRVDPSRPLLVVVTGIRTGVRVPAGQLLWPLDALALSVGDLPVQAGWVRLGFLECLAAFPQGCGSLVLSGPGSTDWRPRLPRCGASRDRSAGPVQGACGGPSPGRAGRGRGFSSRSATRTRTVGAASWSGSTSTRPREVHNNRPDFVPAGLRRPRRLSPWIRVSGVTLGVPVSVPLLGLIAVVLVLTAVILWLARSLLNEVQLRPKVVMR